MAAATTSDRRSKLPAPPSIGDDDNGVLLLLPTDVLCDVLLRLPAAELCRLRLVCRSWRSITSDPAFAKAHSFRHPLVAGLHAIAAAGGNACRREVQLVDLAGNVVRRISTGQTWDKSGNLNAHLDLLCVSQGYGNGRTCVINPSAGGGVVAVLPVDYSDMDKLSRGSRRTFSILGQVPSTGKYEVLRIHRRCSSTGGGEPEQNCHIATPEDGGGMRWRMVPSRPPLRVSASPMHTAVVRGVAYFLPHQPNPTSANAVVCKPYDIASFDLLTEEWRPTLHRGPINSDEQQRRTNSCLLTKLNGCLVTVCNTREFGEWSMDLWFSVDVEKGSWTKRYSLHCAPMSLDSGFVYPLMVLDDERILVWESWKWVLRAYNPRIFEWTDLATIPKYCSLVMYQGSLLCSGLWNES